MNRRTLLGISGIGIASIAGCYGLGQTLTTEDSSAGTDGASADSGSPSGESPTDTPKEDNGSATDAENTTDTEQDQSQSPPDEDPRSVVERANGELVFDEAEDPNYETDELFIRGVIRNASEHPLRNVRLDGYVFVSGEAVGHEYLEYASLESQGERQFELPFFVDDPASIDDHELEVTAAQWG